MLDTRLLLIDGIPGSGKSTLAERIARRIEAAGIPCRFYHELEENHPLHLPGPPITQLATADKIEWFLTTTVGLWQAFAENRLRLQGIAIVESWLYQDTVCFALNLGLDEGIVRGLASAIDAAIRPLAPVLVYLYQCDVSATFGRICAERGSAFSGRLLGLDGGLTAAVSVWQRNQDFVRRLIGQREGPTLVIENSGSDYDDQFRQITAFLGLD